MKQVGAVFVGGIAALAAVTAGSAGVRALITGAEIRDNSIESRDIRNGTIRRGRRGATVGGDAGRDRPAGRDGAAGRDRPARPARASGPPGARGNRSVS